MKKEKYHLVPHEKYPNMFRIMTPKGLCEDFYNRPHAERNLERIKDVDEIISGLKIVALTAASSE